MNIIARIIATVAFAGYSPVAPGTAGSAAAALLLWILPGMGPGPSLALVIILIGVGIWAASIAEKIYGHDASKIVIDEFAGYFIALLFLPKTWVLLLLGFFIFRFFDIFKPWPIHSAERLKGGVGVMADDVLAGVATNIVLRFVIWIFNYLS